MVWKHLKNRYYVIMVIIIITSLAFIYRLMQMQIVHGEEYRVQSEQRLLNSKIVKPPRGEIFDRFGRPLATNRMGFSVQIHKTDISEEQFNEVLLKLYNVINQEERLYTDRFPITTSLPFEFTFSDLEEASKLQQEMKWKKSKKIDSNATPAEVIQELGERYKISDSYSELEARIIIGLREDMKARNFSRNNPFTIATDVSEDIVMRLEEGHLDFPGVTVNVEPIRHYVNGELAAHILGRVGIIYAEEYQKLKDQGYGMNDILGKEGIEKILEPYLRGKEGRKRVEQNVEGQITQVLDSVPPVPGNDAILTIDLELQKVAERSLKENIEKIRQQALDEIAKNPDKKHIGEDAYTGAVVAMDVNTGEILAMATYPTFDPARFNEKYNQLNNDPLMPMLNRAIGGIYPPASTFKALTGIAALEENIISPETKILDKGIYRFYESVGYTPRCWIHQSKYGYQTHGNINVSDALKHSCNYFFYDIGRQLTIEKIDEYAAKFGLGQLTGIELSGESKGILAGPKYWKEVKKQPWYPGDTLGAAIGEYHAFTPIQLASYVSTIANGGKRYRAHLVKYVKSHTDGDKVLEKKPEILSEVNLKPENREAILKGMHSVTEEGGTASRIFKDFPVTVAGKTGTAQKANASDNGVFIGFAPYHNPQIAVAVVIEHGRSGGNTAPVARDIFTAYLRLGEKEQYDSLETDCLVP